MASGSGKTGADGTYTFQVPADIGDKTVSQRFSIDARVTDLNNQETAKNTSVMVHKGLVYPGVAPRGYVSLVGQPADVDLLTVDWASQPVPDQELTIVVSQAEWLSVQKQADDGRFYWTSEVKETPVLTDTVTTDSRGEAVFTWTPQSGGQYKINATVVDELGNAVRSAAFTWVSSGQQGAYVPWRVENNDRIELVADQPLYQVGDTAKVLVPHPYEGPVEALVTIERGRSSRRSRSRSTATARRIEIPIIEDYVPNVFVSVVIVKGGSVGSGLGGRRTDRPQQEESNDLGSFKLGLVELPVDNTVKEITLTLTPSQSVLRPGETVTFTVQAADWQGNPLQAEISLALIDKAILSLAESTNQPLLDSFYRQRGLGVQTASNLVLNLDRLNLQLEEGAKGGGGGDGMMGVERAHGVRGHGAVGPDRRHRRRGQGRGQRHPARQPDHLAAGGHRRDRGHRGRPGHGRDQDHACRCWCGRCCPASSPWATRPRSARWSTTTPSRTAPSRCVMAAQGVTTDGLAEPDRQRAGRPAGQGELAGRGH